MIPENSAVTELSRHIRIAGICLIVYGMIRLVAAVWLISFANTATVMFGTLLNRVSDPFAMMSYFHAFYTFLIALSVACGVLGILSGWGLLTGRRSGRTLGLLASFLSLSDIPMVLALGVYCIFVLLQLPPSCVAHVPLSDSVANLKGHPSVS